MMNRIPKIVNLEQLNKYPGSNPLDKYKRLAKKLERIASKGKSPDKIKISDTFKKAQEFKAYGKKVIDEGTNLAKWNSKWENIGYLKTADLTPYNKCAGLYMHTIDGKVKYIGRAIELHNGGLRKRLSDYRRDNNSARKHKSGSTINKNLDKIITKVLVVGDDEEAVKLTKKLEIEFIALYRPEWNVKTR